MSWFDEQIKLRKQQDDEVFSQSFQLLASSITSESSGFDTNESKQNAIKIVLRNLGFDCKEKLPEEMTNFNDQLDYLCRCYSVMYRKVKLTSGWYKDCTGPILAFLKDGTPVAITSKGLGYCFNYQNKTIRVNRKSAKLLQEEGYCFYKPFSDGKLTSIDLIKYALETRSAKDVIVILTFLALSTLIGLLIPKISYFLYSTVVENKSFTLLFTTVIFYLCVNISNIIFNNYQSMYSCIISTKMTIAIQSATIMRTLALPASFFRKYASGDLAKRTEYLNSLCDNLMNLIFNTGFTSLFSLVYISSIFTYAPALVIPSVVIIFVTIIFSIFTAIVQQRIDRENLQDDAELLGLSYGLVSGIYKIRISGSEKRAFARWADKFAKAIDTDYNGPLILKINTVFSSAISLISTIVMYFFALNSGVDLAQYTAFTAAYGMVYAGFSSITNIGMSIANIKPILEMAKPIMDCQIESNKNKETIFDLNGSIELSHLSFRYDNNSPLVIDDMSFKINPGQYVGIVGKTGCGKSTLIRLLLGFEKGQKGSIYYDGKDINSFDLRFLRRKIGTVLQDSKLFQGDIYSNIVISAPQLSMDDAWQAAEIAGIGDDIREMPMGMRTLLTDGGGGISGGQRQRLVIARAIAPKPKILIFDEATSALDNITQKKVSEALDNLKCTRIVIAHRLSTIKHCDRILYLEDGKIVEDGSYEQLIGKNGLFAKMIKRQILED